MRVKFKSNINFNGNILRVRMPNSFQGKRFEAFYSNGTLIVAEAKGEDKGVKCGWQGPKEKPVAVVQFGKKWVSGCPNFQLKGVEIEYENDQIRIEVPTQSAAQDNTKKSAMSVLSNPRLPVTKQSDTAAASIAFLNKFAADKGYEFEVRDGKLSLVKIERIG